jgi:hypothetical protein
VLGFQAFTITPSWENFKYTVPPVVGGDGVEEVDWRSGPICVLHCPSSPESLT